MTSMRVEFPLGKVSTTRVRFQISRLRRLTALLMRMRRQCSWGACASEPKNVGRLDVLRHIRPLMVCGAQAIAKSVCPSFNSAMLDVLSHGNCPARRLPAR